MEQFRVPVDGGELVATRSGSGAPAVIMHGGPGMSDYTEGLADELDGIFECVRYQQRGVPPSDAPGPFSVDQFVDDALGVLDAANLSDATIIGHSWGAALAQHFVAAHPDRSAALIAIDGPGGLGPAGGWDLFDENFGQILPADIREKVEEMDKRLYAGEGSDEDNKEMMRLVWPYYFADPENPPPMPPMELSVEVYEHIHRSFVGLFDQGRPKKGLRTFKKPALFLHGDADPFPAEPARSTAEIMPNAEFVTFDNCGHFPWMEKPGTIRTAVENWLS